jgi:hypothetical protein
VLKDLVDDPPGFDRAEQIPQLEAGITAFFQRHLLP